MVELRRPVPDAPRSGPRKRAGPLARAQDLPWLARARMLALWAVTMMLGTLLLVVRVPVGGQVMLQEGDVARVDVVAPRQATYESKVLAEQRREVAANAVSDVYDPPQARTGRQQLTLASQILDYVATVRSDGYADPAAKMAYLDALTVIELPPAIAEHILTFSGPAWDRVASEILVVLERAMQAEIRESNLADERRKIAASIRLDLSDEDAAVVSEITRDLLAPNSFLNAEKSAERRQIAREGVAPVTAAVERNETILRAGDIVTASDIEALDALGLRRSAWTWADVRSAGALVCLFGLALLYYLWRQEPKMWLGWTDASLLYLAVLLFLFGSKIAIPAHTVLPYLFPYAAFAMLLSIVFNMRIAFVAAGLFTLIVGWLSGGNVELMAYALIPSIVGTLKLRRGDRLASFAWAAVYVTAANLLVVLAFRVGGGQWDLRALAELATASLTNGPVTITIILVGTYLIGVVFGVTTPLQLMEISRPTHPLLRQLLLKAPGTYHHTLIVSNMAERAAEAIGADSLLTRVGAYYHDVGKTIRPYFFIENRSEGSDPHARLDSFTSAQVIIAHVRDGIDLARKYRLPRRVIEFIPEHHGTSLVTYFYHQAVTAAESGKEVDKALFQYPGPKPQSRETAITMLADGAEATVRSNRPVSAEELERLVSDSMQTRVQSGQLDECPLTMEDLSEISRAFVDVLRGLQHPRIIYPTNVSQASVSVTPGFQPGPEPAHPVALPIEEQADVYPVVNGLSGSSRAF